MKSPKPEASEVVIDSLAVPAQFETYHISFAVAVVEFLVANLLPSVLSPFSQTLPRQATWTAVAIVVGSFMRRRSSLSPGKK